MAAKDIEAGRAYVLLSIRDKMTQGLKLAEKRFSQFGRYAATTGAVMSGSALGGLAWPVKLAADMEQASVSMEVFLGSASAAKKMISAIEMMAAKTPFRFDELLGAANLLLGFGATGEQVIPMLNLLGDVSRGNAEAFSHLALAFGQTMAKGRLMGQEVLQMTEQGFNPLYWLSQVTGKSVATLSKEMEAGAISFSQLVQAFQFATGPGQRFNNMMAKQSETLIGLTSTFLDFFAMLSRSVGETLVPMFKSVLIVANNIAIGFNAVIMANNKLVGTIAKTVLIIGLIGGAFVSLGVAAMAVSFVFGLLASGFSALMSMILAPITLLGVLSSAFMGVVGAVASVATMIVGVFTAIPAMLAALFTPMGLLVAGFVAAGIAALYYRDAVGETFRGVVISISPAIGSLAEFSAAFGRVWEAAGNAVTGIVNALSSGNIELAGAIALGALKAIFYQALAEIPGIGKLIASGFGQAILAGRWDLAAQIGMLNIQLALMQGWNSIQNIWSGLVTGVGALWDTVVYNIRSTWNTASMAIASGMVWVVGKMGDGITGMQILFDGLWTSITALAGGIKLLFTDGIEAAQEFGRKTGEAFRDRTMKRLKDNEQNKSGMQKNISEDAARMEASIKRDFDSSMIGRSEGEQKKIQEGTKQEQDIQLRLNDLNSQATKAADDAGVSTAKDAAFKARYELASLTDEARKRAGAKAEGLSNRVVPGLAGNGLPKVETRGAFTAAAALALGGRSNAQEQTARNTAMANKLLRVIADKRGPQFS